MAIPPSAPGRPAFSSITPVSMTVTWAAPSTDSGSPIDDYILRRYTGSSASGTYVDYHGNSRTRNVTGLTPGWTYTWTAYAHNGSNLNNGYSPQSSAASQLMPGSVWIRVGKKWKRAVPYVRYQKKWHVATVYIRSGGTWHTTQ